MGWVSKADVNTVTRAMVRADWPQVRAIYAAGIATGNATFETEPPDWDVFEDEHTHGLCFVAIDGEEVIGWLRRGQSRTVAPIREWWRTVCMSALATRAATSAAFFFRR
jgi:hypothetical protein